MSTIKQVIIFAPFSIILNNHYGLSLAIDTVYYLYIMNSHYNR